MLKTRGWFVLIVIAALLAPGLSASAQTPDEDSALLAMLRYVPDVEEVYNSEIYFGDIAAWHTSWNVPRPPNLKMFDLLPRVPRSRWMFTMPHQIAPPDTLGLNYAFQDEMRPYYGFDVFMVDRFIHVGNPPDSLTVVESSSIEPETITERLTEVGYTAETLGEWTVHGMYEDYGYDISDGSIPSVGRIGELNRIALTDGALMISRATPNVTAAVNALTGENGSLAENLLFLAGAAALTDPALDDTGELVGAILTARDVVGDPAILLGPSSTAENVEELRAQLFPEGVAPLPPYSLLAFGTRHSADQGASFLVLGVVFLPGTDAEQAAGVIETRIKDYVSLLTGAPLDERWAFDRAFATEAEGLPVAVIVMRVDDPVIDPDSTGPAGRVFSWVDMLYARDLGFLVPGPFEE